MNKPIGLSKAMSVLLSRLPSFQDDDELLEAVEYLRFRWSRGSSLPPTYCSKCGSEYDEDYMLTDELWSRLWPGRKGFLHLKCVEELLGRPLVKTDFKVCPLNTSILYLLGRKE